MAFSSYKSFLMHKASGGNSTTYTKLVDIKSFPDLGSAPEMLDATTLSNKMRVNVPGIEDVDTMEFVANYTSADYDTVSAVAGSEHEFAVWFGGTESGGAITPTGSDGKFEFKGILSVYKSGAGVNEVQEMTISIANTTVITKATSGK